MRAETGMPQLKSFVMGERCRWSNLEQSWWCVVGCNDSGHRKSNSPDPLPTTFAQKERDDVAEASDRYAARMDEGYEQTAIDNYRREAEAARRFALTMRYGDRRAEIVALTRQSATYEQMGIAAPSPDRSTERMAEMAELMISGASWPAIVNLYEHPTRCQRYRSCPICEAP